MVVKIGMHSLILFMGMLFVRSMEKEDYERTISKDFDHHRDEGSVFTGLSQSMWRDSDCMSDKWISPNLTYRQKRIDVEVTLCQHSRQYRSLFVR